MDVKVQLVAELNERLEALGDMTLGTEEYKTALECILKIVDRINEIDKNDSERQLKDKQMHDDKIDRVIRYTMEGVKLGAWGLVLFCSFNFEKYGTLTTPGGRKAIDKLLSIIKI